MNQLSIGMTKEDVVGVLGKPVSTSASEGTELMNYAFAEERVWGFAQPYFIRDGRVVSFGRHGDFGVRPAQPK